MKPPPSLASQLREMAERTGYQLIWPDRYTIARKENERFTLEALKDYGLDRWLSEDAVVELARNVATYTASQFIRRIPYTGAKEIDLDAPARPDAVEGEARGKMLFAFARTLHGRGLDLPEITGCCLTLNESRCAPPLNDREVATIARQVVDRKVRAA